MTGDCYVKFGRGGAGNLYSKSDAVDQAAQDLEAQKANASSPLSIVSSREQAEYVHSGRGGAGNYYSTKDVQSDEVDDTVGTRDVSASTATRSGRFGRGGAGNFDAGAASTGTETCNKTDEAEDIRQKIAADVEADIGRPPKAYIQPHKNEVEDDD